MINRKKILIFIISILAILLVVVNAFLYMHIIRPTQRVNRQLDLGQQYLLDMEYEEAIAAFEIVIELEPKNSTAYMGMAEAYIGMEEYEKAAKILKKGYRETEDEELASLLEEIEAILNREDARVRIVQIDAGEFPNITVYFSLEDADGNFIDDIHPEHIHIQEKNEEEWIEQQGILQFSNEKEASQRSVSMVVDVSGSMSSSLGQLCEAAKGLLNLMQNGNYYVSLTAFADEWATLVDYTNNLSAVYDALDSLYAYGGTALYDTLEDCLYKSINQNGQKYILAFTDGEDNCSSITKEEIISLANYYHVPIYIISNIDYGYAMQEMEDIALESGGGFYSIDSINDLYEVYCDIFTMQESLYSFSYTTGQYDKECGLKVVFSSEHFDGEAENNFISQKPIQRERVGNQMITDIYASSQKVGYPIENIFDSWEDSMWMENEWGSGIGQTIEIKLDEKHNVNGLTIYNGNRLNHDLYEKYSRIKTIRITFSDGSQKQYEVADNFYGPSHVNFINPIHTDLLKIEILEVYEGNAYQDTCISDIIIY